MEDLNTPCDTYKDIYNTKNNIKLHYGNQSPWPSTIEKGIDPINAWLMLTISPPCSIYITLMIYLPTYLLKV